MPKKVNKNSTKKYRQNDGSIVGQYNELLDKLQIEAGRLETKIASLESLGASTSSQMDGLSNEITRLQGQNDALTAERNTVIADGNLATTEFKADIETLSNEKMALEQRISEVNDKEFGNSQLITQLEGEKEGLNTEMSQLKVQYERDT